MRDKPYDHTLEIKRECPQCKGHGIYVGMAERDGYAVVCQECEGKGWNIFQLQYNDPPETKKPRYDVHTVVLCNPGIVLGGEMNFGGCRMAIGLMGSRFRLDQKIGNTHALVGGDSLVVENGSIGKSAMTH